MRARRPATLAVDVGSAAVRLWRGPLFLALLSIAPIVQQDFQFYLWSQFASPHAFSSRWSPGACDSVFE
eukprot:4373825-Pyramimonas_sp.AAC.1